MNRISLSYIKNLSPTTLPLLGSVLLMTNRELYNKYVILLPTPNYERHSIWHNRFINWAEGLGKVERELYGIED